MKTLSRASAIAAGEKYYFTGKSCPHGHIAPRFVSNFGCSVCLRAQSMEYHYKNHDRRMEYFREYAKSHPEANNRRSKDWAKANPEQVSEMRARYYNAAPEVMKAKTRGWQKNNPEKIFCYRRNRRARLKAGGGKVTAAQWEEIKSSHGYMCAHCKKHESVSPLTMDHKTPLSRGGEHKRENIQPLCHSCNCRKGTKVEASV